MGKTQKAKKGPAARKGNTTESPSVASPGKLKKDSPLAPYHWQPGESGNPAGRPKTSDLKAEVRAFADEADPKIRKTRLRQWLEICDRRAKQGSPKHLEMLLAYGWGRPTTPLEHSGEIDLRSVLAEARKRAEAHERAEAAQALLPAPTDANGATQQPPVVTDAAEQDLAREDAAERPARPKIRVEPWAN